jgi:1-acyl-sn-glycerol-3-phosphate acyltransferase
MKKASFFIKYWIIIQTLVTTLRYSLSTLIKTSSWYLKFSRYAARKHVNDIIYHWSRRLLAIVKVNYTIFNPHRVVINSHQRYLIISNHQSHYDIPLIILTFPKNIRMLAKKELFRVPIWGHAMKAAEFPSVDRENFRQAFKDIEHVRKKMQSGIIPWISPEGARSRNGELGPFKKGGFMIAQKTGATIIPIAIRGSRHILPPKTFKFNLGASVEIHIGKPIDATHYTKSQIQSLMDTSRNRIAELLTRS